MKTFMTKFTLLCSSFFLLFAWSIQAQDGEKPSPAAEASGKIGEVSITINYSSPGVKGRAIWGSLVPYGKIWRAGANNATTVEFDKDVMVEGKALPAGKYAFFTIPGEEDWTVIFNKNPNQWGAYDYKESEDALRVTVTPKKSSTMKERLEYSINKKGFVLSWENLDVPVSVK